MNDFEQRARALFDRGMDRTDVYDVLNKEGFDGSQRTIDGYLTAYNTGYINVAARRQCKKLNISLEDLQDLIEGNISDDLENNLFFLLLSHKAGNPAAKDGMNRLVKGYSRHTRLTVLNQLKHALTEKGCLEYGKLTGFGLEILEKYATAEES